MWPVVDVPEEDRATAIGTMQKKMVKIASGLPGISCRTDRRTDTQTHRQTDTQTDALITIPRNGSRGRSKNEGFEK